MDKKKVVAQIQSYLAEELSGLLPAVEKGTLSESEEARVREIQQQLTMYKFLPLREYGEQDVICPGSLVELDLAGRHSFYFIVPSGGGLIMNIDGSPLQVITPNSPLGEALLGRKVGNSVEIPMQKATRTYRIVSMR